MAGAKTLNVVLVHGGFVDASGWEGVYRTLKKYGYRVSVVQNPTSSLAEDVAATRRVLAGLDGPAILVGHSYGGVVITEAGSDPKVEGLVYIAAFAPDRGESVATLIKDPPPGAPVPPILPPREGYLLLDRAKFAASFAADVEPAKAAFMADSQVPWGMDALAGAISEPAWKRKPSWYLVATDDRMIPPPAQRLMSQRAGATVVDPSASPVISRRVRRGTTRIHGCTSSVCSSGNARTVIATSRNSVSTRRVAGRPSPIARATSNARTGSRSKSSTRCSRRRAVGARSVASPTPTTSITTTSRAVCAAFSVGTATSVSASSRTAKTDSPRRWPT